MKKAANTFRPFVLWGVMRLCIVVVVVAIIAGCGDRGNSGAQTRTPTAIPTASPSPTETPAPTLPPPPTKVADCAGQPDGTRCVHPCDNGVCERGFCNGECTPSATATPSRSETPTCAPTLGIVSCCAAHCEPCPTIRAGCNAEPCQDCIERSACDSFPTCLPRGAATPTPTATPTLTLFTYTLVEGSSLTTGQNDPEPMTGTFTVFANPEYIPNTLIDYRIRSVDFRAGAMTIRAGSPPLPRPGELPYSGSLSAVTFDPRPHQVLANVWLLIDDEPVALGGGGYVDSPILPPTFTRIELCGLPANRAV